MSLRRSMKIVLVAIPLFIFLTGCMAGSLTKAPIRKIEAPPDELERKPVVEEGSLWSSMAIPSFFSDVKARQVGDTVTISIVESATASKNASTTTARTSGLEASYSGILDSLTSGFSVNGQKIGTDHKVDFSNNFAGTGSTTDSSSMTSIVTARVAKVLSNGNLVIRGVRQVRLDNENQWFYIQGVIRSEDISSSNVVLSTSIADAMIELSGRGPVSDKQSPGWLARTLDWVWPF